MFLCLCLLLAVAASAGAQTVPSNPQRRPVAAQPADPRAVEMRRAVEEFRTLTAQLGARGATSGPARSSAHAPRLWHGRLFEYFRNDFLDAVPHEVRQRGGAASLLRRNQFGFSLAGPVLLPKLYDGRRSTFFSISYEGTREHIARASLTTLPTAVERGGDFSDLVDKAGQPVEVYDPLATSHNPLYDPAQIVSRENLQHSRERFPDNRIPPSRFDRVAVNSLPHYPLPNASVGPFLRNNYFVNTAESNTPDGMLAKLDHHLLPRHKLGVELAHSKGFHGSPRLFPTIADPSSPDRRYRTRRLELGDTVSLSPHSVLTLSAEASSDEVSTLPEGGRRESIPQALGLSGVSGDVFPSFRLAGYMGMGSYRGAIMVSRRNFYTLAGGYSTRRGRHTLTLTSRLRREQLNAFQPEAPSGVFSFTSGITSLPGIINTGNEFAAFLLGSPSFSETSQVPGPSYFRRSWWQSTARVEYDLQPGLTASVALSLDWSTPRVEKFDRQSTVEPRAINPVNARPGALVFAARGGLGRSLQPVRRALEPRLGLAWSPGNRRGTVLRAAFSRNYYGVPLGSGQFGTQGFNGTPTWVAPNPQLEPALRLERGVPPPVAPLPNLSPAAANDTVADWIDSSSRQPVFTNLSLSFERQLPGDATLTASASAGLGKDWLTGDSIAGLNAVHPDALRFRDQLNDESFLSSLRPYPQYKGFELGGQYPLGRYRYESGYLRLEKRAGRGLSLQASYQFITQRDDYSTGSQDYFHRDNEWSLSASNRPHRLQLHYAYELPFGRGKWLDAGGMLGVVAGGWSVSGATQWLSGDPIELRPEFNNTGGVIRFLRVNVVPGVDPDVERSGPHGWFNPAAFVEPPDFALGNASRTHPSLRNPGFHNHDISVAKRFALASDRTFEFLIEGFNFLNHANWNEPDPIIGPAESPNLNAGKIIGSRGGRVVQLGLRFNF